MGGMNMDINAPMALEEWQQIPSLPGLRKVAIEFEMKWMESEKLVKRFDRDSKLWYNSNCRCEPRVDEQ
jgi:hypothetical protein